MLNMLGIGRVVIVQPGIHLDNRVTIDAVTSSAGQWPGIALLAVSAPDAQIRRRILVDNPARLYGYPP